MARRGPAPPRRHCVHPPGSRGPPGARPGPPGTAAKRSLCRERWPGRVSHSPARCSPEEASRGPGTQPTGRRAWGPHSSQVPPSVRAPGGEHTRSTVMSPHLGSPAEGLSLLAVAAGGPSPSAGTAPSRLSASGAGDPRAGPCSTPPRGQAAPWLAGAALRSSTRSLPSGWGARGTPLCSADPAVGRDCSPGRLSPLPACPLCYPHPTTVTGPSLPTGNMHLPGRPRGAARPGPRPPSCRPQLPAAACSFTTFTQPSSRKPSVTGCHQGLQPPPLGGPTSQC